MTVGKPRGRASFIIGGVVTVLGIVIGVIGIYTFYTVGLGIFGAALIVTGVLVVVRQVRRMREERPAEMSELQKLAGLVKETHSWVSNRNNNFVTADFQINGNKVFVYISQRLYLELTLQDDGQVMIETRDSKRNQDAGTVQKWHIRRGIEETNKARGLIPEKPNK